MSAILPDYGTSADGHLAARVGDLAFIALPCASGLRLASGWRLRRPIGEWSEADVYGSEDTVPDEAGFRAHVEDVALHLTQREALEGAGRRGGPRYRARVRGRGLAGKGEPGRAQRERPAGFALSRSPGDLPP